MFGLRGIEMKIGVAGPVSLNLLTDYLDGGTAPTTYSFPLISHLIRGILERGHEVSVFALSPEVTSPVTINGRKLTVHIGRYRTQHRARDFFAAERRALERAMRADPCDVIHAHWTYEFAMAALATGQNAAITAHDSPFRVVRYMPHPYRVMRAGMALKVLRHCKHLSAVSPSVATDLRMMYGGQRVVELIPNGIQLFKSRNDVRTVEAKHDEVVFLSILNGWSRLKNGKALLRAFALMRQEVPGSRLLMVGHDFGEGQAASLWADRREKRDGVSFLGEVAHSQVLDIMKSRSDVLVHPSLWEACPMSLVEGMALGLPSVGGDRSGGVPWVLDGGGCGTLTNVHRPRRLAAAMIGLAQDGAQRSQLGAAAQTRVQRLFSLDGMISAYESWYKRILAGR